MPKILIASLTLVLLAVHPGSAATIDDLLRLMQVPGVAGHEAPIREFVELRLPPWARPRADNLGNLLVRLGNSGRHTLIVAPLDETGLVVSAITDEGYLRVHRHTAPAAPPLATQYLMGQPVRIVKADGQLVEGVIATPSTHLRAFMPQAEVARVSTLDDIWIDVGVTSRAEVEKLGIRLLDSVTLRERAIRLAGSAVAGVAASPRAATLALHRLIAAYADRPSLQGQQVSLAWITQSQFNNRGLLRLLETLKPDRLIVVRPAPAPADDGRGAVGRLGGGPLIAEADEELQGAAKASGVAIQTVAADRLRVNLPERWKGVAVHAVSVPALFAQTPVETVDARDVEAMTSLLASAAGLPAPTPAPSTADGSTGGVEENGEGVRDARVRVVDPEFITLQPLIEAYGVSGHEAPVRDAIAKALPSWAKPQVDERGNLSVTFGRGGRPLVFVAHMDEVGFELTGIAEDGSASVRARGGMYLSLYEAHPMVVMTPKGRVPAVMAPRRGYAAGRTSQPTIEDLSLYFGTDSAASTRALGVDAGQSATIEKTFAPLGFGRAAGRSMDDRAGCAALLLALRQVDPAAVENTVTFAWVVEEETGLAGATFMAERGASPHTVFAIDTFVSNDSPADTRRLASARLGQGAVLRGMDSRTLVRAEVIDRIVAIARDGKIPLQIGVTSGGTDASAFSATGAIDVGLSWPGKYSHSPVEVLDRRDLAALAQLIAALAASY